MRSERLLYLVFGFHADVNQAKRALLISIVMDKNHLQIAVLMVLSITVKGN